MSYGLDNHQLFHLSGWHVNDLIMQLYENDYECFCQVEYIYNKTMVNYHCGLLGNACVVECY